MIANSPKISPVDFEPEDESISEMITRHRQTLEFRTRTDSAKEGGEFIVGFMHGLAFSVVLYAVGGFLIWLGIKAGV